MVPFIYAALGRTCCSKKRVWVIALCACEVVIVNINGHTDSGNIQSELNKISAVEHPSTKKAVAHPTDKTHKTHKAPKPHVIKHHTSASEH